MSMISRGAVGALTLAVAGQYKTAIAIGALDETLIADLKIDFGMAERTSATVAGDTGFADFEGFRRFDVHRIFRKIQYSHWIITGQRVPATRK
jgi:hypothetical protein